jgi:hypothetical protein
VNIYHSIKRAAAEARFAQVRKATLLSPSAATTYENVMSAHRTNSDRLKALRMDREAATSIKRAEGA